MVSGKTSPRQGLCEPSYPFLTSHYLWTMKRPAQGPLARLGGILYPLPALPSWLITMAFSPFYRYDHPFYDRFPTITMWAKLRSNSDKLTDVLVWGTLIIAAVVAYHHYA